MKADIYGMTSEVGYIQEALKKAPEATASFVNVVFFKDDDMDDYNASLLPFRTTGNVTFETAFRFQETIRQVVRMQESKGFIFNQQRVGVIVADTKMGNAEMIVDAVVGVFRAANAIIMFEIATDRTRWLNTATQQQGTLPPLDNQP